MFSKAAMEYAEQFKNVQHTPVNMMFYNLTAVVRKFWTWDILVRCIVNVLEEMTNYFEKYDFFGVNFALIVHVYVVISIYSFTEKLTYAFTAF